MHNLEKHQSSEF